MKGGVVLAQSWSGTSDDALNFFLSNSTFKILADNSVASYVYICRLNDGVVTPYTSMRSDNFYTPVNSILLKIFFHCDEYQEDYTIEGIHRYGVRDDKEMTTAYRVDYEVSAQHRIYSRSFSDELTPCEPICPAIISYTTNLHKTKVNELWKNIKNNLILRDIDRDEPIYYTDEEITDFIFTERKMGTFISRKLSVVAMELMDGYNTLRNIFNTTPREERSNIILMWAWNFARLKNVMQIEHRDLHLSNILFNPDKHFYSDTNPNYFGQIIIIDFGRFSERYKKKPMPKSETNWKQAIYGSRFNWLSMMGLNASIGIFRSSGIDFGKFSKKIIKSLNEMTTLRKEKADKFIREFKEKYDVEFQDICKQLVTDRKEIKSLRNKSLKSIKSNSNSSNKSIKSISSNNNTRESNTRGSNTHGSYKRGSYKRGSYTLNQLNFSGGNGENVIENVSKENMIDLMRAELSTHIGNFDITTRKNNLKTNKTNKTKKNI